MFHVERFKSLAKLGVPRGTVRANTTHRRLDVQIRGQMILD